MKQHKSIPWILLVAVLLASVLSLETAVAQDETSTSTDLQSITIPTDREVIIIAEKTGTPPPAIAAPMSKMMLNKMQTASFQINYIDAANTWDKQPEAKAAFQYASDIWATLVASPVPIVIDAYWEPMANPSILGSAGATTISLNDSAFPYANTWYPAALANKLAGRDLNGTKAEIKARFNSNQTSWYFGTDLNTPFTEFNFVTVVLHEIGHGLGFFGTMEYENGIGSWGIKSNITPLPVIYDRFTENGLGTSLINTNVYPNPSTALGEQLTSNYLFFDAFYTRQANGGATAPIYAPPTWNDGSSYSHLSDTYDGTINALMTQSLYRGETNYNPGPVALGLLNDLGWNTSNPIAAELQPLPGQLILINTSINNAFNVNDYTTYGTFGDANLSYELTDNGTEEAGITFTYPTVSINPDLDWTGKTTATIQVIDQLNQPSTSTFFVSVTDTIYHTYLPIISK